MSEHLSTVPSQATPNQAPAPSRNRRLNNRRPPRSGVKVTCRKGATGLGPNIARSLLDVSESGVRLLVGEVLPEKREVEVCLQAAGQAREVRVTGRVAWCVPCDGGACVGIQFDKRLDYATFNTVSRAAAK